MRQPIHRTRSNITTLRRLSALRIFLFGGLSPVRTMLIIEGETPFFFAHSFWPPARFTSERSKRTTYFWSSARMSVGNESVPSWLIGPTRIRLLTAVNLEAKEPRTREHFRKRESYGYIRRAQKHNNRRSSGGDNRRDHLLLRRGPLRRHIPQLPQGPPQLAAASHPVGSKN